MNLPKVIFKNKAGEGLVLNDEQDTSIILMVLDWKRIKIGSEEICPGDKTTLNGYFTKPLLFKGVNKFKEKGQKHQELIFFMGKNGDNNYYRIINYVQQNQFFIIVEDKEKIEFNFHENKWI